MRIFERTLDTAKEAISLNERGLLQGNQTIQFVFKLKEYEQPITFPADTKPTLIYRYQYGSNAISVNDTALDYPATMVGNELTISPNQYTGRDNIRLV